MPVPKPSENESQDAFMGRCMGFLAEENKKKSDNDKWPRKQMVAICFSQWKNKGEASELPDGAEATKEFIEKFLEKYPEYKEYFE